MNTVGKYIYLLLLLCPAFLIAQKCDSIVYVSPKSPTSYSRIVFYEDGRFLQKAGCDVCAFDTVAYGKYVYCDNAYYLFSDPKYCGHILQCNGQEEYDVSLQDSITIEIISPYENDALKSSFARGLYFYNVKLYLFSSEDSSKFVNIQSYYIHDNNKITVSKPAHLFVKEIRIQIHTTSFEMYISGAGTLYSVKNRNANIIQINMPDFTTHYMALKRYDNTKVEILDNDCIRFNNGIIQCKHDETFEYIYDKYKTKCDTIVKEPYDYLPYYNYFKFW